MLKQARSSHSYTPDEKGTLQRARSTIASRCAEARHYSIPIVRHSVERKCIVRLHKGISLPLSEVKLCGYSATDTMNTFFYVVAGKGSHCAWTVATAQQVKRSLDTDHRECTIVSQSLTGFTATKLQARKVL